MVYSRPLRCGFAFAIVFVLVFVFELVFVFADFVFGVATSLVLAISGFGFDGDFTTPGLVAFAGDAPATTFAGDAVDVGFTGVLTGEKASMRRGATVTLS